ncbi:MAG: Fur family transcriptional regulator [Paracoccaceae bacterium]|nr:Fur family transcriptional regulator [Paracoccaceae bacterium]MDG1739548.1 Fur family transcriptional regulator [Paracoccaceae bacterium]MDG2258200.1 Fur family transcriptional regulator [Paracoccaceae bacterium]
MSDLPFAEHDHTHCASGGLIHADRLAEEKGLRLTPVRRAALEILLSGHRAMGAYEVLDHLKNKGFGSQPPVAYRALDFLVENGLAHRVQRLNAFAACTQPSKHHRPVFMICRDCEQVAEAEADEVQETLINVAARADFEIERVNVEILGLCPSCKVDPA